MPIDNSINNRTFEELFTNPINFEIPFFQRTYSWEREQWKQLIDDVWEQIITDVFEHITDKNDPEEITKEKIEKHLFEHEHYYGNRQFVLVRHYYPSVCSMSSSVGGTMQNFSQEPF